MASPLKSERFQVCMACPKRERWVLVDAPSADGDRANKVRVDGEGTRRLPRHLRTAVPEYRAEGSAKASAPLAPPYVQNLTQARS